jgi:hypothetical protein
MRRLALPGRREASELERMHKQWRGSFQWQPSKLEEHYKTLRLSRCEQGQTTSGHEESRRCKRCLIVS